MLERVFSEMDRHLYKLLSAIKIEMLNISPFISHSFPRFWIEDEGATSVRQMYD